MFNIEEVKDEINALPVKATVKPNMTGITKISLTSKEVLSGKAFPVDKRQSYAGNTKSFTTACIGDNATYALDSAHKGGSWIETSDGMKFRVGAKGRMAIQQYIDNTSAPQIESAPQQEGE